MNTKTSILLGLNIWAAKLDPWNKCTTPAQTVLHQMLVKSLLENSWMELLVSPWNFGKSVECLSEQGRITPISGRTLKYGASKKLDFVYLHIGASCWKWLESMAHISQGWVSTKNWLLTSVLPTVGMRKLTANSNQQIQECISRWNLHQYFILYHILEIQF